MSKDKDYFSEKGVPEESFRDVTKPPDYWLIPAVLRMVIAEPN